MMTSDSEKEKLFPNESPMGKLSVGGGGLYSTFKNAKIANNVGMETDGKSETCSDNPSGKPQLLLEDIERGNYGGEWSSTSWSHSLRRLWKGYAPWETMHSSSHRVRDFYENQNSLLEQFVVNSIGHEHLSAEEQAFVDRCAEDIGDLRLKQVEKEKANVGLAIFVSNVCNVMLLCAQSYAFLNTMSMSILASLIDATLDFVSGLMIYFTWRMKCQRDKYSYPVGQSRLEPLGVIGMACLMTSATIVTLQESVAVLIGGPERSNFVGLSGEVVFIIVLALLTKVSLYLYCRRSHDMSVKSLAVDHLNDVIANSTSLSTVFLAQIFFWWLDPVGGIVISMLIIKNWVQHTLEHVQKLLGKVADKEMLSLLTFIACNHHPKIHKVDTVRAYHVGTGLFVECDVVLPSDMFLWEAHDIGESLQNRIETLPDVDRAFVHLDTEAEHSPYVEHKII